LLESNKCYDCSPIKIGTMVTTKMVPPLSAPAVAAASVVVELLVNSSLLLLLMAGLEVVEVVLGINRVVLHTPTKFIYNA
jgi:hypothetical protein